MAGSALRRLMAEYKRKFSSKLIPAYSDRFQELSLTLITNFSLLELTLNPPEGIVAGPINEENFFEWEAFIMYDIYD